jgi:non-homologous end joining protein Ku
VMAMIEAKAEGLPIPVEVASAPPVGDLMTALEASLEAAKQQRRAS